VGKFVERVLGAAGREPFASLKEAADAADALDRKLFMPARRSKSKTETAGTPRTKWSRLLVIGLAGLLLVAVLSWYWWHFLPHS